MAGSAEVLRIPGQLLPVMDHGHDLQVIVSLAIYDSIGSGQQFPQVVVWIFRHPATTVWDSFELNDAFNKAFDQHFGISMRFLGNVPLNGGEPSLRLGRPDNLHSLKPSDSRRASLVKVRSASRSASPRSIERRTATS